MELWWKCDEKKTETTKVGTQWIKVEEKMVHLWQRPDNYWIKCKNVLENCWQNFGYFTQSTI